MGTEAPTTKIYSSIPKKASCCLCVYTLVKKYLALLNGVESRDTTYEEYTIPVPDWRMLGTKFWYNYVIDIKKEIRI
jgi:hypothetical protein